MRRWWFARASKSERITSAQRALRMPKRAPRARPEYLRVARWWELEACRGYASSASSAQYARNMRWAAETVALRGRAGAWLELVKESR
jgi:hypothetical protein